MDKSIVVVEEGHTRSDHLIRIESIAIDIGCEMDPPQHEHFTIRGFVAGMRKRNLKICSPFDSEDNLPSLSVPKFRWWQCSDCVPETVPERNALEMLQPARTDIAATSSYDTVGGEKGCLFLPKVENAGSKDQGGIRSNEGGNPSGYVEDAKPIQIRDGQDSSEDDSDMAHDVENASIRADIQENGSSGNDDAFAAIPHRRKQKLRSLADIMDTEMPSASGHLRTGSASSNGTRSTSTAVEAESGKWGWSPRRKRKTALDESRPPPETKRLKGHVREVEITHRRVEISDSEAETVASIRSELHASSSMPRIKPKLIKVMHRNKSRQVHFDNRRVITRVGSKLNARKAAGAPATSLGCTAPLGRDTVPFLDGLPSGETTQRNSEASDSMRPEDEAGNSFLVPHSSIHEKVALDLSLNSCNAAERSSKIEKRSMELRDIPDLNESITERTSVMEESELPTISQKKSLILDKTSDISVSATKSNAREDERPLDVSEVGTIRRTDKNVEAGGASDDIPMEIVELLARNQQERALESSRNYFPPRNIDTSSGGGSRAVDLDGCSGKINFPFANMNIAATQGILNSPWEKNCTYIPGVSQLRLFSPLTQNQQRNNTACLASNSITSGSEKSERADLLWTPRRKNSPSTTQTNGFSLPFSAANQCSMGKTIYDASGLKSVGSLDAYSNLDIPAMQLLSLTNQGIASSHPFHVGRYGFLDKPFSPSNHHPGLNRNENKDEPIFSSSFFPQSSPVKSNVANVSCESFNISYLHAEMSPQQGSSKAAHSTGRSNLGPPLPSDDPTLEVCALNRNPADFGFHDANNEFMISAKDLKFRKRPTLKKRLPPVTGEVQKRKWVRKNSHGGQGVLYNDQEQQHKIKKVRKVLPQKNTQTNTYC